MKYCVLFSVGTLLSEKKINPDEKNEPFQRGNVFWFYSHSLIKNMPQLKGFSDWKITKKFKVICLFHFSTCKTLGVFLALIDIWEELIPAEVPEGGRGGSQTPCTCLHVLGCYQACDTLESYQAPRWKDCNFIFCN